MATPNGREASDKGVRVQSSRAVARFDLMARIGRVRAVRMIMVNVSCLRKGTPMFDDMNRLGENQQRECR